MKLSDEVAIYFRDQFREARAKALRDAEGFQEILFVLERFGAFLKGKVEVLNAYKKSIEKVALISPLADDIPGRFQSWHMSFSRLYDLVRKARNDALHQGTFARHLTRNAVQLSLVLEDALMSNQNTAGDYMVRESVCASPWQPLSFIRQQMLENSFTYIPVWSSTQWQLVSDYHVARYLRQGDRKLKLAKTLEEAVSDGLILEQVNICLADASINEVFKKSNGKPVLVVEKQTERLVGIVTPFDLL